MRRRSLSSTLSFLSGALKPTSRHLFHEDLDVSVLRNRAQVLNDVPVLQVLVEGDFLVERLRVPKPREEQVLEASSVKERGDPVWPTCCLSRGSL